MDTHTHDAVSKSVKVAKQQDLLATEAQINDTSKHTTSPSDSTVIGRAKAKHDRKLAKAADAALHNARQGHDDCKMASRKTRYAESQFPFFRLPAEIRGNVYTLVLAKFVQCALRSFKPPPLLQVSQQIRSEAIGLLTTVDGIELRIRSNYVAVKPDHTPVTQDFFHHDIGLLQLDGARSKWLEDNKSVFLNVEILVQCTSWEISIIGRFFIGGPFNKHKYTTRWMVLYPHTPNYEPLKKMFTDISTDVEKLLKATEARPGFIGLKLSDLKQIAKCFDYVKRE